MTAHYRMVDRVLEGRLREVLWDLYGQTANWEEVSRRLYAEHDVVVSGQTLRRWAPQIGLDPQEASA